MDKQKQFQWQELFKLIPVGVVAGLTLIPVGIVLLHIFHTEMLELSNEFQVDYTDCQSQESSTNQTCPEYMRENNIQKCKCYTYFTLPNNLEGNVTVYYDLETFQFNSSQFKSRDDDQLSGNLSLTPSESCEPYRYDVTADGRKPIAPCGALADFIFNDTYFIIEAESKSFVPMIYTGMIPESEKKSFRNPPGVLEEAFSNFTKPKNWAANIWELDKTNPENNGFQNEVFIGWMKSEWRRKPVWRINHTEPYYQNGLPSGSYVLRAQYNYPLSRYDGRRRLVLIARRTIEHPSKYFVLGIILVAVGSVCLMAGIILFILWKREKAHQMENELCYNEEHRRINAS